MALEEINPKKSSKTNSKIGHKILFEHAGSEIEGVILEDKATGLKGVNEQDYEYKTRCDDGFNYYLKKETIIKIYE